MNINALKILMVEDDPLNRTLANHLFKKIGCTYKLTETDAILTAEAKSTGYDLVFVDIETLEGYTVIEKIRNEEMDIPVIGMTIDSNNMLLPKCYDAGMNDYILKPLKLDDLSDKISLTVTNTTTASTKKQTPIFDYEKFYVTCGSNKATAKNIITLFLTHTPDNMKLLENYFHDQDWDNLKGLSHRIKVVYSLMGLPEVKNYFDEIENDISSKSINTDTLRSHLTLITERSMQLMHELKEIKI